MFLLLFALIIALSLVGYFIGRSKAKKMVMAVKQGDALDGKVHSLPFYYGAYIALVIFLPAILILLLSVFLLPVFYDNAIQIEFAAHIQSLSIPQLEVFMRDVHALASGNIASQTSAERVAASELYTQLQFKGDMATWITVLLISGVSGIVAYRQIGPRFRARNKVEKIVRVIMILSALIAILTTIGIVMSLIFESLRFFQKIPFFDFLFGIHWSPQTSIRPGQVSSEGSFGAIPLFAGTMLITFIAMIVAAPIGLMSAIYLSDYASPKFRSAAKPILEVLAGIPTVVYGFFAALTIAPLIRGWGEAVGLTVASESALTAGLVMGIMIIPFVSSLSDDVINAVPQAMRDGAYGLGATKSETIRQVVLPAALPGIVSALLLAMSRAIGETMIVVMAAGLAANLTINPLEAVTTVTVQIVTLLVGDQEFDSAKTLAAFALGLMLFCITLMLNVIALRVVQKYREQYE